MKSHFKIQFFTNHIFFWKKKVNYQAECCLRILNSNNLLKTSPFSKSLNRPVLCSNSKFQCKFNSLKFDEKMTNLGKRIIFILLTILSPQGFDRNVFRDPWKRILQGFPTDFTEILRKFIQVSLSLFLQVFFFSNSIRCSSMKFLKDF